MNVINESWVINISEEGDYKKVFVSCCIQCKVIILLCYTLFKGDFVAVIIIMLNLLWDYS